MREFFKLYFGYLWNLLELVGCAFKWLLNVVFSITMAGVVGGIVYYLYYKFGILRLCGGAILLGIIGIPAQMAWSEMQYRKAEKKENAAVKTE